MEDIADKKEINIIDIGGGGGHFANTVKSFYDGGGATTNMTVIDYCKYDEWEEFEGINFIHENAFDALKKVENDCADIIFINATLHHLTFDTYKKTRGAQKSILELAYSKIKKHGYLCLRENYAQCPIIGGISMPLVYYMTKSQNPITIKISKKMGANSAGVGVCFFSPALLVRTLRKIGFVLVDMAITPWKWDIKYIIRHNKVALVFRK